MAAENTGKELEARRKIEALLFSSGRKMTAAELAKISKESEATVKKEIELLRQEYDSANSPMMIVQEGDSYKMTIRERYLSYVKKIVPKTDMNKTIIETLAIIAWKAPILQSDVIKIRTNKGYDHIDQLEEAGFISKKKHGRSYMINLTQKFYDYFDLLGDSELKKAFKRIDGIAKKSPKSESAKIVGNLEVYGNSKEEGSEEEIKAYAGSASEKSPIKLIISKAAVEEKNQPQEEEKEENMPEKAAKDEEARENEIINRMLLGDNKKKEGAEKENAPNAPEEGLAKDAIKFEEGASAIELAKKILSGDSQKKKPKLDLFEDEEEEKQEEEESQEKEESKDSKTEDSDDSELDKIFSEEEEKEDKK